MDFSRAQRAKEQINDNPVPAIQVNATTFAVQSFNEKRKAQNYIVIIGRLKVPIQAQQSLVSYKSSVGTRVMIYRQSVIGVNTRSTTKLSHPRSTGCSCADFANRSFSDKGKNNALYGCKHMILVDFLLQEQSGT